MHARSDDERDGGNPRADEPETGKPEPDKPANVAPDAVMDPNEKTGGKPGVPAGSQDGEADPGGS